MVTMDLLVVELADLETRVGFENQNVWREGKGLGKVMMWRAALRGNFLIAPSATDEAIPYQFAASSMAVGTSRRLVAHPPPCH